MQNNRHNGQNTRTRLLRTIDNKRTISSEQSYYTRNQHNRKFTIQYLDPKKSLRQPLVQRKNQSLPKSLTNQQNNIHNNTTQNNIHSRKLIYNSSHSIFNDVKSSNKTIPTNTNQTDIYPKIDLSKNNKFVSAIQMYVDKKYQQAIVKFNQVLDQVKIQGVKQEQIAKIYYYLGLAYWYTQKIQKSIFNLSKALDLGYQFSTESYELLSIFYQSTKNYNCALKTIDLWLKVESNAKAHLMRARIFFLFKQYAKAIIDYGECYRIEPTKLQAYIQQAESIYKLHGLDKTIQKYNHLLVNYNRIWPQSQHSDINYVKYKKSLLLLQQKIYTQSLLLLTQVNNPQLQSQVNYYIGIIHSIQNKYQQAILSFTKSIQSNTSSKFISQSYYQKLLLMFKRNDYYGIQHQLDIIQDKYIDNQGLQLLRVVIQVNRQKYSNLCQTIHFIKKIEKFLAKQYPHSKYSHYIPYIDLIKHYNNITIQKIKNIHNLITIKLAIDANYNQSLELFQDAQNVQPFNTHTYMVKAIVQIMFYNVLFYEKEDGEDVKNKGGNQDKKRNTKDKDKDKQDTARNQQILLSAQQLLNRCLQKQLQNDQLLYILSTINYQLGQYQSSLKLIRKAIDSSDDHTIKHYYLKANTKIMLSMYSQAISDYSNAILVMTQQQNKKQKQIGLQNSEKQPLIYQCYLQRAKCYILEDSYEKAQADLRIFFSQLQNVKKYQHQLELFMHVGCADVILDIYKSILQQQYDLYSKMKCYYLSKQLNNCLNIMNILLQYSQQQQYQSIYQQQQKNFTPQKLQFDRDCLQALKKSAQGSVLLIEQSLLIFQNKLSSKLQGDIFQKSDCIFYAGVMSFLLQQYSKAKNYFIDAKSQKLQNNQISKSQLDQSLTIENKLFSLEQINYNIGICDFIQGKWSNYLEQYTEFKKCHQAVTESLMQDGESQEITPFLIKNRLCSIYPPHKLGNVSFRLSFCLPKIHLKQVVFHKNNNLIQSIKFKDIDMRPSAPWIQKSKKGIIFTTEALKQSIDLKSEKSKKCNNKKKGEERYKQIQHN